VRPDCTSPACYKCDTDEDGKEIYNSRATGYDIDCLNTGYARDENGEVYKWAIMCGPCSFGCVENENRAKGEYDCFAARQFAEGANRTTTRATVSYRYPCHYVQLAECGCAPEDVYTFGLDPPAKACQTEEDCPYLCNDAPGDAVKDLCNAFDIEWWLGSNSLGSTSEFHDDNPGNNPPIVIEIFDEQAPE